MQVVARFIPIVCLVVLGRTIALADEPTTVRLVYVRAAGAESCPDEDQVRAGVAARLGRDPFRTDAGKIVFATLSRSTDSLMGKIEVRDLDGKSLGVRDVMSDKNDCAEMTASMELAIAIAVDPLALAAPPPEPAVGSPPSPPPVTPSTTGASLVVTAQPRSSPPELPVRMHAGAGLLLAFGSAPSSAVGISLGVDLRRGRLSLGLEGRADMPAESSAGAGTISGSLLLASVVPCFRPGPFSACGLVSIGAFRGAGHDLDDARQVSTPYLGMGGRAAWEFPVGGLLGAIHLDLIAPLSRTRLTISGDEVWSNSPVSAVLGFRLGGKIL